MSIPIKLEKAAQRWLQTNSSPDGLCVFRAVRGGGELLEIRCGQSDDGEHPEAGVIICRCVEETVQQFVPLPMVNHWKAILTIELRYPGFARSDDPSTVEAWRFVADELRAVLVTQRIAEHLSNTGEGVDVQGLIEPIMVRSGINAKMRTFEWFFSLAVSELETIEELS